MYAFFAYSVGRETAEDLTSGVFERVLRAWDDFDPSRASERTWLLAIARNALTDHYRRQRLRTTVSTDEHPGLVEHLAAQHGDPLARALSVEGIVNWLSQLAEREREVLALRYGADLSAREIADLTGMTEGNVHQIASRSLRRLRELAETAISDSA